MLNSNMNRTMTSQYKLKTRNSMNKRTINENLYSYLIMSPSLIIFILFTVYPIMWATRYCLYNYTGSGIALYIGLDNFKNLFNFENSWGNNNSFTWLYWSSWGKTILYTVIKLVIEMPLAFLCAYFINKKVKGSDFFKTVFYMPQILPSMVMFLVFNIMLNPYNGILNIFFSDIGIIPKYYSFFRTGTSAFLTGIFVDIWHTFGINMLFFLVGLTSIPTEVYESASVDGATEFKVFIYITLPMLARMTQIILLMAIIGCLKSTGSYFILTGGGPNHATELVFLFIYYLFFPQISSGTSDPRYGFGAAVAIITAFIIAIISIIYYKVSNKFQYE